MFSIKKYSDFRNRKKKEKTEISKKKKTKTLPLCADGPRPSVAAQARKHAGVRGETRFCR